MSPAPATMAAKAAAKSGLPPDRIWMATLETVAIMARMPSAVVFIFLWGCWTQNPELLIHNRHPISSYFSQGDEKETRNLWV